MEKILGMLDSHTKTQSTLPNFQVARDADTLEVLSGLQKRQKTLPSKYFYDRRGSILFDQICKLDAYYLTRTETGILGDNIRDIANLIGPQATIIEYGSGSSLKTGLLLNHLPEIAAYVPVDISKDHLLDTAENLHFKYPDLTILPQWADFTKAFSLPVYKNGFSRKLAFFPGSTIGNFYPQQAIAFLQNVAALVGPGGGLLIGVDLQKDPDILNWAYNDGKGITAAFNLNMLTHINQKFQADFVESQFEHFAFYNQLAGRIEMHLVSKKDQLVSIAGSMIDFLQGEHILTEVSYKYTLAGFARIAAQAGFDLHKIWSDPKQYFSVQYLVAR
jgi:dimethylhistidine N-methyltransferase